MRCRRNWSTARSEREATYPCGSGLARESSGSVNINACWADVFAAMRRSDKPAPTFDLHCFEHWVRLTDRH
ncbi:hypothetical protein D7M10_11660 [Pseudomonas fluorescens]|nr:hypothetical protein D7M10_11660 [Pseudomonas fluorescens]